MQTRLIPRIAKALENNKSFRTAIGSNGIIAAFFVAFAYTPVHAQATKYGIISPIEGAAVSAAKEVEIQFDFRNEEKAQHVHLFIDDTQIGMTHKAYGKIMAGPLTVGKRKICIGPVNANHTPIGEKSCINVIAE